MKILFVQDHLRSGGAARAADRWARLLARAGHKVRQVAGDEPSAAGLLLTGKPPRGWPRILEWFGDAAVDRRNIVRKKFGELLPEEAPDLVWFHNLAGGAKWGWSEEMLTIARQYAPVLWTLHDMWALGDSSQSYWQEDQRVEGGRGQGAGKNNVEGGRGQGARVQRVCGEGGKFPVTLTAPSKWLADLTKKIARQECVFLPNPIDLEIYSPGDRTEARRQLGLPKDGRVVLAGADSLRDRRKGFDLLREAWNRLPRDRATLAMFGRHGEGRPGERYLGNLTLDEEMVAAYRAADLYLHPARMENAPCTIQESLACGTPVVAFAVGGIPEMIEPGKTGFLVPQLDSQSLGNELSTAFADPTELGSMRAGCRKAAEEIWGPDALGKRFLGVIEGVKG